MAEFKNCQVSHPKYQSDEHPLRAHTFQVETVNAARPNQAGSVPSALLFCTSCGASYILGNDGRWHEMEIGETWASGRQSA